MWPLVGQVVLRSVVRCPQQKINYAALGEKVKKVLLTDGVVLFVCPELSGSCVRVFEDNQEAIALPANSLSSARSKNVEVRMCLCFCPVYGFPIAWLSLAVLRSWLVLNVFSVGQCCGEQGRVLVWIVPAMTVSCSRGVLKYVQAI